MNDKQNIKYSSIGFAVLIALIMSQTTILFLQVYYKQSFSLFELILSLSVLLAMFVGFFIPIGISVVLLFIFIVSCIVWFITYAKVDGLIISWFLMVPAVLILTSIIKSSLIQTRKVIERLNIMEKNNPEVDINTTLNNEQSFNFTLIKQANLARRYPDKYSFCLAIFKIDFLPLVQELLGKDEYTKFLLKLSDTIQQQLRYEDFKFSLNKGRFIILCPMAKQEYLESLSKRIKDAMMAVEVYDKHGRPLNFVIRSGAIAFDPSEYASNEQLHTIISTLERRSETDLIAEYV